MTQAPELVRYLVLNINFIQNLTILLLSVGMYFTSRAIRALQAQINLITGARDG